MKNKKLFKRIIAIVTSFAMSLVLVHSSGLNANAFDTDYVNKDGMALGYSIINGYSKLSIEHDQYKGNTIAVYCGLDVTNLYTMAAVGLYYVTHGVDIDRIMTDNEYALIHIEKLNNYLKNAGIKNERAIQYKPQILENAKRVHTCYDTLGLYIIDATDKYALELMNKDYVDFVLDGGCVPRNLKDLNMDGKSDKTDALMIQKYLVDIMNFSDDDKHEYARFVCDIDGDTEADIRDVTKLLKDNL